MLKRITAPWRRFFNDRFESTQSVVREEVRRSEVHLDSLLRDHLVREKQRMQPLIEAIDGLHDSALDMFSAFGRNLSQISADLQPSLDALFEVTNADGQLNRGIQLLDLVARKIGAGTFDPGTQGDLAGLDEYHAQVANFATGHIGWASQAGLWFNPPVNPVHEPGGVRIATINERIVEVPFVFGALHDLADSSRILDVGCAESTVALSLASMGYKVTGVDARAYPLTHPNLEVVAKGVEELEGAQLFDAVVSLSTVEHIGVGTYDGPVETDGDIRAMTRMRELTRLGGRLVFTAPYGRSNLSPLQRVYDDDRLAALLKGWTITTRKYLTRQDDVTWRSSSMPGDPGTDGVILLVGLRSE